MLGSCGQPHSSSVLTPAEPTPDTTSDSEESTADSPSEATELDTPTEETTEPEPEPEPEIPPIQVWTAPEGEDIPCENTRIPFTFEPNAQGHSLTHAFWTMWFAKRSFTGGDPATEAELRELGFDNYRFLVNELAGLQVLIIANDETMVVAFQGSKDLIDWFANFYFFQQDAEHGVVGRVHQGFAAVLDSEWEQIIGTIEHFGRPGQQIWLSGHSLGAALATLSAARLVAAGYDLAPLYTHASPRVGDTQFAEAFYEQTGGKHYRIANDVDIVPHLPPAGAAAHAAANFIPLGLTSFGEGFLSDLGYAHAGELYRIETDGALTHFPGLQEEEDTDYWSNLDVGSLFDMITNSTQEVLHNESTYLCRLRDLWLEDTATP
jgi:triacylglycerol lipase